MSCVGFHLDDVHRSGDELGRGYRFDGEMSWSNKLCYEFDWKGR